MMTELSYFLAERVLHNSVNVMKRQRDELGTVTIVILVLAALLIVGIVAMYAVMGAVLLGNLPS